MEIELRNDPDTSLAGSTGSPILNFENGILSETRQNCFTDNCNCVSHHKWETEEISVERALVLLQRELTARDERAANLEDWIDILQEKISRRNRLIKNLRER